MKTLEPLLAKHPFFQGLEPRFVELLTGCAYNRRYEQGEFLFREGEPSNHFYIIREGQVAIEAHAPGRAPVTVETLGEGDVLGWSWLIPPYQRYFSARAVERTRAFALDAQCLRMKSDEDHDLGYELTRRFLVIIAQRLQAARLQLLDVYGVPAELERP